MKRTPDMLAKWKLRKLLRRTDTTMTWSEIQEHDRAKLERICNRYIITSRSDHADLPHGMADDSAHLVSRSWIHNKAHGY